MFPETALFPCSSNLENSIRGDDLIKQGLVVHPCNRLMASSHVDTPLLTRCDITTRRMWTFTDNCGQSISVPQLIRVLPLQQPVYPKNGELNVNLLQILKWPTYPNSRKYKIFVWKYGTLRKNGKDVFNAYYRPGSEDAYPPNSKMLWQVEYILDPGYLINNISLVPSPIWGFVTKQIPDYKVITISAPKMFFTGRSLRISWTVKNIGTRGNSRSVWYDRVSLSKDVNSLWGQITTTVRRKGFLFPNDGYTGSAILSIPDDMIGDYFVRVITDIYSFVADLDRSNNRATSLQPITIKLTPPPDLQVTKIVIPAKSFSGRYYLHVIPIYTI